MALIKLIGNSMNRNAVARRGRVNDAMSPETTAATYARISRDPRPISEIREDAEHDVEACQKTNETVVFDYGHASIAEHATLNYDITDISRLAVEYIEWHRLASYTERSQRYTNLSGDIYEPTEFVGTPLHSKFQSLAQLSCEKYGEIRDKLIECFRYKRVPNPDKKADEDARYVALLATTTQLGMTINARIAELMIRRFRANPLLEVQSLGSQLHNETKSVAPSLIRHAEHTSYDRQYWENTAACPHIMQPDHVQGVELLHWSGRGSIEAMYLALNNRVTGSISSTTTMLKPAAREQLLRSILCRQDIWDMPPRELELVTFTFMITLSASCFAQLKRHRIATLIPFQYCPELGITLPQSIELCSNCAGIARHVHRQSRILWLHIMSKYPELGYAAPYLLTNGCRRNVVLSFNARELHHIMKLRLDVHAQAEIRSVANDILRLIKNVAPEVCVMAVAKHKFAKEAERERKLL